MAESRKNFEVVAIMHKAFWILKKKGQTAFRVYADENGLSDEDIERIENRLKMETDPEFRKRIKGKLKAVLDRMSGSKNDLVIEDEIPF